MPNIPVTFTIDNKEIHGFLCDVPGMAAPAWHLLVNNFYWGCLWYSEPRQEWRFDEQAPRAAHHLDYFVAVVTAWYG